jgi:hypothetical protein
MKRIVCKMRRDSRYSVGLKFGIIDVMLTAGKSAFTVTNWLKKQ